MNEASRKQLLSSTSARADAKMSSSGVNSLSDGFADAYSGVRNLDLPVTAVGDDDDVAESTGHKEGTRIDARTLALGLGIFALAALPRLFVLFFVTDLDNPGVGWYNDSFHHWQIGYLSKEIGFSQGFLKLWDFKGMEYFWGPLHPIALAALFKLTGSVDILLPRSLGLIASCFALTFLFFLLKRYFGIKVAVGATLLATMNPVAVFADVSGMQGPIALSLVFIGMLLWPRSPAWAGFAFGLAGTARAEYWVFSGGLVVLSFLTTEKSDRKLKLLAGWLIPTIAYARYLTVNTGNAIYPVYWNFIGNAAGEWRPEGPLNETEVAARWGFRIVFLLSGLLVLWILRRRDRAFLFLMFGAGIIAFNGLFWGFTEAVRGWDERAFYDRLFIVPYMIVAIGLVVAVTNLASKMGKGRLISTIGLIPILGFAMLSQLAWTPVLRFYDTPKPLWEAEKNLADQIALAHREGSIAIPDDRMPLTYLLAVAHEIPAQQLKSQMYDPFFYFDSDPFARWSENRDELVAWFRKEDIRLIVFYSGNEDYQEMIRREPDWFSHVESGLNGLVEIYKVADF